MTDHMSDGTPIMWVTCGCWVWPIAASGMGIGSCGKCGSRDFSEVPRPASGKAGPL